MFLIDIILNFAGLLLWLKWRDETTRRGVIAPVISLASALKQTGSRYPHPFYLLALLLLLVLRSLFYWQLGSSLGWNPKIHFAFLALPFRSDYFGRIFFYSFLSFGSVLTIFYLSLLFFSIVNHHSNKTDLAQKWIQAQLGTWERWPFLFKLLLPWMAGLVLWCLLGKILVWMGIQPPPKSFVHLVEQGVVLGLGVYLAWKYLIVGILLLYLLNSYVYLGNLPFWAFISNTAHQLLKWISWVPLRIGKIDFAPVITTIIVILIADFAGERLLWIYQRLPF